MQIPIPNKELIDPTTIKKIEVAGFAIKPSGPAEVLFSVSPTVATILNSEFFEFDDSFSKTVDYVQFKYSHSNAVKSATWHNKDNNTMLTRSGYIKIGIPESILLNENNIQALQLETAEVKDGETKDYVPLEISLERLRAVEFVDLDLDTYEKCAKIQIRVFYKNNISEIFKFSHKTQAVYRSKLLLEAQSYVRHKTSELYEDSTEGRNSCLLELEDKTNTVCKLRKETKGTKNLVYYTIFFDRGYIELLDKSVMSILEQSEINFDLLLITDSETKAKLESCVFRDKITPKYLTVETPLDGVEASQNKTRVFEYEDIDSYDKILFLDCDIVCLKDINSIFNEELEHETLYTARNTNIRWHHHKSFHHGFELLGDLHVREMMYARQMPFNAGQFLFRNSSRMRAHFNNVNWFMKNWAGEYFFEQAFMCYYFCKAYLTDDSVLNKYMSIISTTTTIEHGITEDTCLVHFIAPPLDAKTKLKFIDFFLAEHCNNINSVEK
jgi:lipopolysaccharide biosynthesis glycosyltransferase